MNVLPVVSSQSESKRNGIGFVCSSDTKPQTDFHLAMASRRASLSGNASLIATFSSYYAASLSERSGL